MSATWTPLDRNTHALRLGGRSPRFARAGARDRAPQRIRRKRTPGWRMPEGAVYVGRLAALIDRICRWVESRGNLL